MDIIGKRAKVTRVDGNNFRGYGFIVNLPEYLHSANCGDTHAVVYTASGKDNYCAFCSFTHLNEVEDGILVELEEE